MDRAVRREGGVAEDARREGLRGMMKQHMTGKGLGWQERGGQSFGSEGLWSRREGESVIARGSVR